MKKILTQKKFDVLFRRESKSVFGAKSDDIFRKTVVAKSDTEAKEVIVKNWSTNGYVARVLSVTRGDYR